MLNLRGSTAKGYLFETYAFENNGLFFFRKYAFVWYRLFYLKAFIKMFLSKLFYGFFLEIKDFSNIAKML